jgi:hypothetical protein
MTRKLLTAAFVVVGTMSLGGCDKPSEEDCRKAIANMQALFGTDKLLASEDIMGAVRRCKGSSKKQSVQCAIDAKSLEALEQCDFMKVPAKK